MTTNSWPSPTNRCKHISCRFRTSSPFHAQILTTLRAFSAGYDVRRVPWEAAVQRAGHKFTIVRTHSHRCSLSPQSAFSSRCRRRRSGEPQNRSPSHHSCADPDAMRGRPHQARGWSLDHVQAPEDESPPMHVLTKEQSLYLTLIQGRICLG